MAARLISLLWLGSLSILLSCHQDVTYSDIQAIPDKGWAKDSLRHFYFRPDNQTIPSTENIFFVLRNNNDYPFSNLYLFVTLQSPNGFKRTDTLQYLTAQKDGTWLGKGIGNTKESVLLYLDNFPVQDTGLYRISVQQGMREDPLPGIEELGIMFQKSSLHEQKNN